MGARIYLIHPRETVSFCNQVNSGFEPRRWIHGMYFMRTSDVNKHAAGLPQVPSAWRPYLLRKPLTARLTRAIDADSGVVNVGSADGVRPKMEFLDLNIGGLCFLEVVSCGAHDCTVRKSYADSDREPLAAGDDLSTSRKKRTHRPVRSYSPPSPVGAVLRRDHIDAFDWIGDTVLAADEFASTKPTYTTIDISTGKTQNAPKIANAYNVDDPWTGEQISSNGRWVLTSDKGGILCIDVGTGARRHWPWVKVVGEEESLWISGDRFATFIWDKGDFGSVDIVDATTGVLTHQDIDPDVTYGLRNASASEALLTVDGLIHCTNWDFYDRYNLKSVTVYLVPVMGKLADVQSTSIPFPPHTEVDKIVFSPNGKRIAWKFVRGEGKDRTVGIWVSDIDGSRMKPIAQTPYDPRDGYSTPYDEKSIQWSPDGKQVGFIYDYKLWTAGVGH